MNELLIKVQYGERSNIYHECPFCNKLTRYYEDNCDMCLTAIPDSFWSTAHSTAIELSDDEYFVIADDTVNTIEADILDEYKIYDKLTMLYGPQDTITLCCGQHYKDCVCSDQIDFTSFVNADDFDIDVVYKDRQCESCAMWYTPWCAPLISHINDVIDRVDPNDIEPITVCSDYCTVEQLDAVSVEDVASAHWDYLEGN